VQGDIVIMKHKFTYYFCKKANEVGLAVSMDVIDEVREQAHIREFAAKQRAARRYNSSVTPKEMK
jgi:hypothetical protein